MLSVFFFQAEDGIRDIGVTGVQTCALPICGDPGMNSYNHYAYGAVADWIYRYAAGIDTLPSDPGFHTILIHPNFDRQLGNLEFSYESSYGTIHSAWSITGNTATWKLTIPANAKGR